MEPVLPGHPSPALEPNQLVAVERLQWNLSCLVTPHQLWNPKPVGCSREVAVGPVLPGHPSPALGPNQLVAVERWQWNLSSSGTQPVGCSREVIVLSRKSAAAGGQLRCCLPGDC